MAPSPATHLLLGPGARDAVALLNIDHKYHPGDLVPWRFMPEIIVASFFASLTGTLLTVELLHRKRLGKSIVSRFVLKS